jgi:hypothetical protein
MIVIRLLLIGLLLFAIPANATWLSYSGAVDYSDIVHFWTVETVADPYWGSGDCSSLDTTPSLTGATVSTTAVRIGTYGLYCNNDYYRAQFDGFDINLTTTEYMEGKWVRFATFVDNVTFTRLYNAIAGPYNLELRMIGTSNDIELKLRTDITDYITTTDCNMDQSTWYFIQLALDDTGNRMSVLVDGVVKGTYSSAWTGNLTMEYRMGNLAASGAVVYIDNFIVGNDYDSSNVYDLRNNTSYPVGACQ